jgi:anaerobic selenocysteine-containing dehydrogenase
MITFGPRYPALYRDTSRLPKLQVIWGCNLIQVKGPAIRQWLRSSLLEGGKLVVIDPKRIDIAKRADLWLRPRPASDGALALGLLKVTVEEKLYDEAFVSRFAVGFEELKEELRNFTLDDVERVTWVPREQIIQFARMYAESRPAVIHTGNALVHGMNSFQTERAVDIFQAISGPPNTPGTDISVKPGPYTRPGSFFLISKFPRPAEKTVGGEYKFASMSAYIPHHALLGAILEEKPYPIKAAVVILANPLSCYPDARRTYEAFKKLDFTVVAEIFMTPTAALADVVLPAATAGEYDGMGYWGEEGALNPLRAFPKLVDPPGEAWPDIKWMNELAIRLGLREYFWDSYEEALTLMLKPSNLSMADFKQKRIIEAKKEYKELVDGAFDTASGKIEIYSKSAQEIYGYSPLPRWEELSHLTFETTEDFPLVLTSRMEDAYKLTGFKELEYSRKIKPQPEVEMNPETARKLGLKEGNWVHIETKKGTITQKLVLDPDLDPRVVYVSFGWWFPETPDNLFEWDKANLNILMDNDPADPTTGAVEVRGIPCRVY